MEVTEMLTVSSLIDFLINLLRDPAAQAQFEQDPHGMLLQHGLGSLSAQDVQDVLPMVADHECVHVKDGYHASGHHVAYHGDDPVRAISQITQHYEVKNVVMNDSHDYNLTYVDDRHYVDDHSDHSASIQAGGDVTVNDSFHDGSDNTVVNDSFNKDNHGVDNTGGTINNSAVAGHDLDNSQNSDNHSTVSNSHNSDNSETNVQASDDHSTGTHVQDSYNHEDTDVTHVDGTQTQDEHSLSEHSLDEHHLDDEASHHDLAVHPA
jgi:hypothetical protein